MNLMEAFNLGEEYRQVLELHPNWSEDVHTKCYYRNKRHFTLAFQPLRRLENEKDDADNKPSDAQSFVVSAFKEYYVQEEPNPKHRKKDTVPQSLPLAVPDKVDVSQPPTSSVTSNARDSPSDMED